jgi:predicted nucleotidyltransferase
MTETKHRHVLAKLIRELSAQYPSCGTLVWGSVMRGTERPNSDLDVFVVVQGGGAMRTLQGWQDGKRHPENYMDGVCLDITIMPAETLADVLQDEPYKCWFFAHSQIVHDPMGLAKKHLDVAAAYFDTHPAVEAIWKETAAITQELKPKLKENPEADITLPAWDEVARQAAEVAKRESQT